MDNECDYHHCDSEKKRHFCGYHFCNEHNWYLRKLTSKERPVDLYEWVEKKTGSIEG